MHSAYKKEKNIDKNNNNCLNEVQKCYLEV